jgi:Flp pilus assembly pilin Flp
MKLLNIFKTFKNDESGAVTVDWVVLTAAIVGLGLVVMTTVSGGIGTLSTTISTDLAATTTGTP